METVVKWEFAGGCAKIANSESRVLRFPKGDVEVRGVNSFSAHLSELEIKSEIDILNSRISGSCFPIGRLSTHFY